MAKTQASFYAIIPADVRYSDIPPNAKLLYGEITALCNKEGFCWATNSYFAQLYKVAPTTISDWIRKLRDRGFVDYEILDKTKRKIYLTLREKPKGVSGKAEGYPSGKAEHNNTSINNTTNTAAEAADPPKNPLKKKKRKYDDPTPMNLREFVEWYKNSPQRHIQIIGDYADQKKANFTTKGQWQAFSDRNLIAAWNLTPYTAEQIAEAVKRIFKSEYIDRWTLETVAKYLIT